MISTNISQLKRSGRTSLIREGWRAEQGYKVLRFWNNEVLTNTKGILDVIRDYLNHPPPTPSVLLIDGPPLKGGEVWIIPTGKPGEPKY